MKWISVKDEFPSLNKYDERIGVLISDGKKVGIAFFYHDYLFDENNTVEKRFQSYYPFDIETDYITHWMPLPSKPENLDKNKDNITLLRK